MPAPQTYAPDAVAPPLRPFSGLPFHGVTVLAVEDSRFASDALRLLCQRSGARLRRAETLAAARQHLRVYRPDAVIVDLGLPDGRGEGLIQELSMSRARPALVLAISGDPSGRSDAMAAGAQGFLEKPIASLAAFQQALAPVVGWGGEGECAETRPLYDRMPTPDADLPLPDPLALQDDLRHAAAMVQAVPDARARQYLRGFLGGVARHAHDPALAEAARIADDAEALARLAALLTRRLHEGEAAFRPQ